MYKWLAIVGALATATVAYYLVSIPDPVVVTVTEAGAGRVESTVANTRAGTVKACRRSRLSMPIGGRVAELNVSEGDSVPDGAVLLTLWNADRGAALDQARAGLNVAEHRRRQVCLDADHDQREARRIARLFLKGAVSEEQVDRYNTTAESSALACETAGAEVSAARAVVEVQQAQYDLTVLRAPFAGVVAKINGEIGEYVTPSPPGVPTPPAIDLIDTGCLYVTAPIDEVDAADISLGLEARVTLDAFRNRYFPGSLTRIAPYVTEIEKQARTVDVDVELGSLPGDIKLLVGYSADIELILEVRESVLRVPTEVIVEGRYVWVIDGDGRASRRDVETGLGNWSWTEIVSGLDGGERVISSLDADGLAEGAAVTAAPIDSR
ncbi:MAG: efflux RND transporter periplasmic adaptor subunit [Proteobacteria bacterium]|nr:MAG: efflux RND transporter periplasmic adaptor subunit [Pseudomonadota bacterium]